MLTLVANDIRPSASRRLEAHAAATQPVTTLAVAVAVVGSFVMLLQVHWLLEMPAALAGAVVAGAGVYAMLARPSTLIVSTATLKAAGLIEGFGFTSTVAGAQAGVHAFIVSQQFEIPPPPYDQAPFQNALGNLPFAR